MVIYRQNCGKCEPKPKKWNFTTRFKMAIVNSRLDEIFDQESSKWSTFYVVCRQIIKLAGQSDERGGDEQFVSAEKNKRFSTK